jgi:hypothetical protein
MVIFLPKERDGCTGVRFGLANGSRPKRKTTERREHRNPASDHIQPHGGHFGSLPLPDRSHIRLPVEYLQSTARGPTHSANLHQRPSGATDRSS